MRTLSKAEIRRIAVDFRAGRGRAWPWVSDSVQEALIDAEVMDQVRAAHSADAENPITPAQLVELRQQIAEALARIDYTTAATYDDEITRRRGSVS